MPTAIGIDIGGTNTRAALISSDGKILEHVAGPTARTAQGVYEDILSRIATLRGSDTIAAGLGIPGRVDARTGRILSGGYVDLSGFGLADRLQQETGLATFADNDANMALAAEAQIGAARSHRHAVMLTIGTGIGGAILSDGKIFHGGGTAGQLGHITSNPAGGSCNCGRRGCIETEASGSALAQRIAAAGLPTGTRVETLLKDSSSAARAVIEAWAHALRGATDSLAACFAPDVIVLGGGLGHAAAEALQSVPAISPWFQYQVLPAQLGDEAGVIGAGLAALGRAP